MDLRFTLGLAVGVLLGLAPARAVLGGALVEERSDANGDGTPDTFTFLEDGVRVRVERDTNRDGVVDVVEYFERGRKVRQAEARQRCAKLNYLFDFAEDQKTIIRREEDRDCDGRPEGLSRFDAQGQPLFRCSSAETVETLSYVGGKMAEALEDTTGDGFADRHEIYQNGKLARLEVDSNADRKPDVWARFVDGKQTFQDEDTNFDGLIDVRFEVPSERPVRIEGNRAPPTLELFKRVECRDFSAFWSR